MQFSLDKLKNMPQSAKIGVTLWLLGWIWFLVVYYKLTQDMDWVYKLSIALGLLAIFISQALNWARLLSVLANSMGVLLSILFFYKGLVFIAAVNFVLFVSAVYFLMVPSTTKYFKLQTKPGGRSDDR